MFRTIDLFAALKEGDSCSEVKLSFGSGLLKPREYLIQVSIAVQLGEAFCLMMIGVTQDCDARLEKIRTKLLATFGLDAVAPTGVRAGNQFCSIVFILIEHEFNP